ncbi:MAG: hypothetical protein P4M14_07000 [Gammaproteobacteria bacterium]|nr:hypothetical protein [Gammaproteobacteria bacterium]
MPDIKKLIQDADREFETAIVNHNDAVKTFKKEADPKKFLAQLKERIQLLEQMKYPNPPFECKTVKVEVDGKPSSILYVKSGGETKLSKEQLNQIEDVSFLIRQLSLLAGVAGGLSAKNYVKSPGEQLANIRELANAAVTEFESGNNKNKLLDKMNRFVDILYDGFSKSQGFNKDEARIHKDETMSKIRNAEKFFVADLNADRYILNESVIANKTILQLDVPFNNKLTANQIKEYDKLKAGGKDWFSDMADWEKDSLYQMALGNDFQSKFQSSAMQTLPGVKNARTNYLIEKKDDDYAVLSRSVKTATQVPYEAPERFREKLAELNTEQIIQQTRQENNERFNALWGKALPLGKVKPLIFFHSLLSDATVFGRDDKMLVDTQARAVQAAAAKVAGEFDVIQGNDPVNILRAAVGDAGSIRSLIGREENWDHVNKLQDYAKPFLNVNIFGLNETQAHNLHLLKSASQALKDLPDKKVSLDRNRAAFKSAYIGLMVEAMGGTVISNCKSGKDRTGLDELYRNAMRIYFETEKKLPLYDDPPAQRQKFIDIFIPLFNSLKTQEAAAANTPGSFGIKDTAKMMCPDIADQLGLSYKKSNERSGINKPPELTKNETAQKTDQKKRDQLFSEMKNAPLESSKSKSNMRDFTTSESTAANINTLKHDLLDRFMSNGDDSIQNQRNQLRELAASVTKGNSPARSEMLAAIRTLDDNLARRSQLLETLLATTMTPEKLKTDMKKGGKEFDPSGASASKKTELYTKRFQMMTEFFLTAANEARIDLSKTEALLGGQAGKKAFVTMGKTDQDSLANLGALREKYETSIASKPGISSSAAVMASIQPPVSSKKISALSSFGGNGDADMKPAASVHPVPPPLLSTWQKGIKNSSSVEEQPYQHSIKVK